MLLTEHRKLARSLLAILAFVWAIYLAHLLAGVGGSGLNGFFNNGVSTFLELGASFTILARGLLSPRERLPWLVLGAGALLWSLGDIYFTLALQDRHPVPVPSLADAGYLAFYAAAFAALTMLMRSRWRGVRGGLLFDGALVAAAGAAVVAALALAPIMAGTGGDSPAAVATNLAYPFGDLTIAVVATVAFAVSGWRPGPAWLVLGFAFLLLAAADGTYLYESSVNAYVPGTWLDATWPAGLGLLALAAWTRRGEPDLRVGDGARVHLVPVAAVLAAIAVLVLGNFMSVYAPAVVLAAVALLLAVLRMCVMLGENGRLLASMRCQTMTDALTGLGNRRRLYDDLQAAIEHATQDSPLALVVYDLNGFKLYNDTFGHLAGDALLARLANRLAGATAQLGTAYRMGGDEFCAVLRCPDGAVAQAIASTAAALSERGPGFAVGCCHGVALVPAEASTARQALALADERLYAQKDARPDNVRRQLRDVVLLSLQENEPLRHHHQGAGRLVAAIGHRLGLDDEAAALLAQAAELHDIGKLAIPEMILDKPGPLDDGEWTFMRRHTLLGERLLAASPAMAALVRSSHERWDGEGYPDGLAGEQIPLAARVLAVCDAFDAMTTDRAYNPAISRAAAIRRLRQSAGSQFDPRVVSAFLAALGSEHAHWAARSREQRDADMAPQAVASLAD